MAFGLAVAPLGGGLRLPRVAARARRRAGQDHHCSSTARCSPTRTARSPAAWRTSSSPPGCRSCSRAVSASRPAPVSTCTRSVSRSASSPASRRSTSRRWCRCGWPPTPSRAATRSCSSRARRTRPPRCGSRASGRRRGCPTASSPSSRATRKPSTRCSTHPDVEAVSFVGSTPIARYIYETGTAHGKRVQALGGAKNHMVVLPDADIDLAADAAVSAAYGAAGERCMSISVAVAVGDAGDRARRRHRGPAAEAARRRRHRPGLADGPADHRRAPRQGGRLHRRRRRVRRHRGGRRAGGRRPGRRLLPRHHAAGQRHPRHERLHRRDLRPGAVGGAHRHLRRRAGADQRQPVRERHRDLHPRRRRGAAVPVRRAGGHGRHQRADPGAGVVLLVRRLEGLAVRRHAHVRAGRHQLLHARQGRDVALAGPGHVDRRPRLPRTR